MLTFRNKECGVHATTTGFHQPLDQLTKAEARALFLKAARLTHHEHQDDEENVEAVTSLLGRHSLALIMASSYITRRQRSVGHYREAFLDQERRILKYETVQTVSRYGNIFATFEASAVSLESSDEQASKHALDLLHLASMYGGIPLPLSLFTKTWIYSRNITSHVAKEGLGSMRQPASWHANQLPKLLELQAAEWNDSRLTDAYRVLKAHSLISVLRDEQGLSIHTHPLILTWGKECQSLEDQYQSWLAAVCALVIVISSGDDASETRRDWFRGHVNAVLCPGVPFMLAAGPQRMIASVLYQLYFHLFSLWRYKKACNLMRDLLTTLGLDMEHVEQS